MRRHRMFSEPSSPSLRGDHNRKQLQIHHCSERERSRKNVTAHRRFKAPSSGTKRRSTVCALAVHASLLSYQAPQAARQRRDTTLAEAPSWLTFGCRDGSEGGSRGSFQSREPIGPLLGQVNGWGRVPGTGDGGDALAVWFRVGFGCIFSRTWLGTRGPETETLLSVAGRWGRNPRDPGGLLPGLAGGRLRGAILLGGVRGEGLDAPHGRAVRAAAVGIAWAGRAETGESSTGPFWSQSPKCSAATWPHCSARPGLENCPQLCRKALKNSSELHYSRKAVYVSLWNHVASWSISGADLKSDKMCFWNRTHQ